jgi:DNA-binding MarR family transcriptional regulator
MRLAMKIKALEGQVGILRILVYLCKRKSSASLSLLMKDTKVTQGALYNTIKKAVGLGLIEQRQEDKFPYRKTISLTDKGLKIAKLLSEIDLML